MEKLKWKFNKAYGSHYSVQNGLASGWNIRRSGNTYELYQRFKWYVGEFSDVKKAKRIAQEIHNG